MADEQVKAMGGGCLGGLLGALLGIVIGGILGPVIATSHNELRNVPDPAAKSISDVFDGCLGFLGMLVGSGIGGIIGGIGGSIVGAGLASKSSTAPTEVHPTGKDSEPGGLPEPPTESPDAELARLKEKVAELERKKQNEDLTRNE